MEALSSDTGGFLFREFEEKIGFFHTLDQHLVLKDERRYAMHFNESLLHHKIRYLLHQRVENESVYV